jgi:folate-binding protein YgfZ
VREARARAGFSLSEPYLLAGVSGPDARSFLDTQLPADLARLAPGEGVMTAYLDRRGRITHLLLLLAGETGYRVLLPAGPGEGPAGFLGKLERFHIREKVQLEDHSGEWAVIEVHGPDAPGALAALIGERIDTGRFRHREFHRDGRPLHIVFDPWTGDPGGHLIVARSDLEFWKERLRGAGGERGLVELDAPAMEILRIEGGRPRLGVDLGESNLLLELDDPAMLSHEKGCYLGQETVARVHSRGHVNRLWRGFEVEGERIPPRGTVIEKEGEPVGMVGSAVFSPSLDRVVGLGFLRPRAAPEGTVVHLGIPGAPVAARVREVPLYRRPGPAEQAETEYREGLRRFEKGEFEEALGRFEKAVLMNPRHAAAFESMGICEERLGRREDARRTMESLAGMEPGNIMAWTNLSRYAAEEGRIEEAERLKAKVLHLVWKKEAGERKAREREEEDREARRAYLEDRVELFRRVLELDPDDVVANFGLGKVYLDLGRFEEAIPRFEKAIEKQEDYSMAYDHLGTCLVQVGRREEAGPVFRKGIEAATRRGDRVPERSMTRKLRELAG